MKVYLVEDTENAPGRIYAVFAEEQDALDFAVMCLADCEVVERTLFYGLPPHRGYNE